jgi:predicted mannosyl-3-phosphoglycerate phosphatase (HAD superfamily)
MIVGLDFDGTCVTHEYPKIGRNIGAQPVLKDLVKAGHKLVLFTMRSGKELKEAEEWFEENEIPLFGSNVNPEQKEWTDSPKAYCHLYIDDAGLGMPLMKMGSLETPLSIVRPFVNWTKVRKMLENKGVL